MSLAISFSDNLKYAQAQTSKFLWKFWVVLVGTILFIPMVLFYYTFYNNTVDLFDYIEAYVGNAAKFFEHINSEVEKFTEEMGGIGSFGVLFLEWLIPTIYVSNHIEYDYYLVILFIHTIHLKLLVWVISGDGGSMTVRYLQSIVQYFIT